MMSIHRMRVTYEIEIRAINMHEAADIVGESLPKGARLTALRSIQVVPIKEAGK